MNKSRPMVEYLDRVHQENERLRRENSDILARLAALQLERGTWECRFNRAFAGWERIQDQVDRLLGKLEAR